MRCIWWLLVASLIVGCKSEPDPVPDPELEDNPLDAADPSQGFASAAWASTRSALADGTRAEVSESDRILFVSDPLGVAGFAAEIERERTYCKTPPCPLDPAVAGALTAFLQKSTDYTPILVAHEDALSAWGALAAAHQALGIANVLDQAGVLTATGRDEIAQASSPLMQAAGAYATLDWATVPAVITGDPKITAVPLGHAPVIVPSPNIDAAATATVTALLAEVDRETAGGTMPLSPLCCSETMNAPLFGSPAYQAIRRLAMVREWADLNALPSEIESYRSALVTLASKTLSGAPDNTWTTFEMESLPYVTAISTHLSAFDAAELVVNPGTTFSPPVDPYIDPNATEPQPNVANTTTAYGPGGPTRPFVQLRTNMWIPHAKYAAPYRPNYLDPPATPAPPPHTDGVTQVIPAGLIAIDWSITAAAPIDHIDIRIGRIRRSDGSPLGDPFLHYIERPTAAGLPTRTYFDPLTMDPEAPAILPTIREIVFYEIRAIAVDVHGHASRLATTEVVVQFSNPLPRTTADLQTNFLPTEVRVRGYDQEIDDFFPGDTRDQVAIHPYTTSTGSYVAYDPSFVIMSSTTGPLMVTNLDTVAHRLRAVFTAPYLVDPDLFDVSIDHVQPLDLGVIPAGNAIPVSLPAGATSGTFWTLYDTDLPPTTSHPTALKVIVAP